MWPLLTHFIAVLIAGVSVTKGVKTIEKVSMVLVPLLLLIILFTFVWSLTREYADYGIKFLFSPKWGTYLHLTQVDFKVWLSTCIFFIEKAHLRRILNCCEKNT